MAVNKNAFVRYKVLDECFRNWRKRYYIEDLLDAVNDYMREHGLAEVETDQIRKDFAFMETEAGGAVPLVHHKDGKQTWYRYSDRDFSILNLPLAQWEVEMLGDTIEMLNRFKGLPNYRWLEPSLAMMKEKFGLYGTPKGTVSLAQNEELKGLEWFGDLFEAIVSERQVDIKYHRFGRPTRVRRVHPYQLRQWNYRWYVVGYEERLDRHTYVVVPLDRIEDVIVTKEKVKGGKDAEQIREHFKQIVGVSLLPEGKPVTVKLKAYYPAAWYLETKPIHWTQEEIEEERGKDYKIFKLEVIPNEELVQQIMVYADQTEVLEPEWVRLRLIDRAKAILVKNGIR